MGFHVLSVFWKQPKMVVTALVAAVAIWFVSPVARLDQTWSDVYLTSHATAVSQPIYRVEITPQDVEAFGGLPFQREVIAEVLDRLNTIGARRVLMDFRFVSSVSPQGDAALVDAVLRFDKDRIAVADSINFDLPVFAPLKDNATLVSASLYPDQDGRFRTIRTQGGANPSAWLATGESTTDAVPMDLTLDTRSVQQFSISELMSDSKALDLMYDSLVVLSMDQKVAPSGMYMPMTGEVSRGAVIGVGAASHLNGHSAQAAMAELFLACLAAFVFISAILAAAHMRRLKYVIAAFVSTSMVTTALSFVVVKAFHTAAFPVLTTSMFFSVALTVFAFRLQIPTLIATMIKGDTSPEEAWIWRSYGDRQIPVVLFDANGGIKRANEAASGLIATRQHALGPLCMPRLGHREQKLVLRGTLMLDDLVMKLEWPSPTIPLVVFHDISASVQREQMMKKKLITDTLTGAANRVGFDAALDEVAAKGDGAFAIFYMDMNGFKAVNDTHGHQTGDELLINAAKRFQNCLRQQDILARLGGDEFAVLISEKLSREQMREIALKLEASLHKPIGIGKTVVSVGVSVGFAAPLFANEPVADVIKRADAAMYQRKMAIKKHIAQMERLKLSA